jgi:hypothetical protein
VLLHALDGEALVESLARDPVVGREFRVHEVCPHAAWQVMRGRVPRRAQACNGADGNRTGRGSFCPCATGLCTSEEWLAAQNLTGYIRYVGLLPAEPVAELVACSLPGLATPPPAEPAPPRTSRREPRRSPGTVRKSVWSPCFPAEGWWPGAARGHPEDRLL